MKILYLTIIFLISNLFWAEIGNSKELRDKEQTEIEVGLIKRDNISESDEILENIPKINLDLIRKRVIFDKDIFSYKNIELYKSKINQFNFKLIGLVEIEGIKTILISSTDQIKSFKEGEIIDNKYKIKEISLRPAYVIFQNSENSENSEKIYLNK